ncbi:hypothetical protein ACG83_29855 [Frankia sp. R43]|uniref:CATRA conflict system CASPASE/TPR repeat-associated protein n=1 Tax=Frankia sp. R43 TaxID=269536 RepID=UPI0006DB1C36|nr:CATRA conflict system CASPASE/TPR repeat-associated protein [Frankia sp. R43]KPM52529.1 hypothetical protein ACG83_29855 [Frankia sp. R43]
MSAHDRMPSAVVDAELVVLLFAPLRGPQAGPAYEYLRTLWERCATILSMGHVVAGLGLRADAPVAVDTTGPGGPIAAQERPEQGVFQALLRQEHDMITLAVMLAPDPGSRTGWADLDAQWSAVAADVPASLLGAVRVYQGTVSPRPESEAPLAATAEVAELYGGDLPELPLSRGWERRGTATASGFALWEPGSSADDRAQRHLMLLAPAGQVRALSALTWTDGSFGAPPLARYLGHCAALRHLVRAWDGGRAVRRFRERVDGRSAALGDGLGRAGLIDTVASAAHGSGTRPDELHGQASGLRVDQFHLVNITTTLVDMRRSARIATSNMRAAMPHAVTSGSAAAAGAGAGGSEPHPESPFLDDRALAIHLSRQLEDELVFLGTVARRADSVIAVADRLGLAATVTSDVLFDLLERKALRDAVAEMFPPGPSAHQILEEIGVPRGRQPVVGQGTAQQWWGEVFAAFDLGIVATPYRRLLSAAIANYPASATLEALAARRGIADAQAPPAERGDKE